MSWESQKSKHMIHYSNSPLDEVLTEESPSQTDDAQLVYRADNHVRTFIIVTSSQFSP